MIQKVAMSRVEEIERKTHIRCEIFLPEAGNKLGAARMHWNQRITRPALWLSINTLAYPCTASADVVTWKQRDQEKERKNDFEKKNAEKIGDFENSENASRNGTHKENSSKTSPKERSYSERVGKKKNKSAKYSSAAPTSDYRNCWCKKPLFLVVF